MKTNDLFISLKSEPRTADVEEKKTHENNKSARNDQQGAINERDEIMKVKTIKIDSHVPLW